MWTSRQLHAASQDCTIVTYLLHLKSKVFVQILMGAAVEKNPLQAMREFRLDEKLLFEPVPAQKGSLKCIYAYPNEYTVGICSLGYQLVWSQMAASPDIHVARLFTDAHEDLPSSPDLLGFSLSWELDYANVLSLLEKLGISIWSRDRLLSDPIIFGGGAVFTANPEPYAEFFDVILLGDGENLLREFLQAVEATRGATDRLERLQALAQVPGVYVPILYQPCYESADGELLRVDTVSDNVPSRVVKQTYKGNVLASSTVVSPKMAWENIYMVEVVRSCPEMCRFCLASYVTLPFRTASLEASLYPSIHRGLEVTSRIGLLGASVTQHPEFEKLLLYLCQPQFEDVRLSIASVRTNTVTPQLAEALAQRGTKSITVAVESGSERVRRIVNKKLAQDEIMTAAINAEAGGLEALKLYGMVGVPGEEMEDVEQTVEMMKAIKAAAPKLRLTLGCSTFAHTPFQWYGVSKDGEKRLQYLEKEMRRIGVSFRPESYKWSLIQALLSRGDRRLSKVLLAVRGFGDSYGSYRRAFKEMKGQLPPMEHYIHDNWKPGATILPWSHLQGALPEQTLVKHQEEATQYMGVASQPTMVP
eukprot:jgi/Chlat1/2168/Chrsp17S02848